MSRAATSGIAKPNTLGGSSGINVSLTFVILLPKVKLVSHQTVITTATTHELFVCAHFHYFAPVNQDDLVCVSDRAHSVGNHDRGFPAHDFMQSSHDNALCFSIEGTGGLNAETESVIVAR